MAQLHGRPPTSTTTAHIVCSIAIDNAGILEHWPRCKPSSIAARTRPSGGSPSRGSQPLDHTKGKVAERAACHKLHRQARPGSEQAEQSPQPHMACNGLAKGRARYEGQETRMYKSDAANRKRCQVSMLYALSMTEPHCQGALEAAQPWKFRLDIHPVSSAAH